MRCGFEPFQGVVCPLASGFECVDDETDDCDPNTSELPGPCPTVCAPTVAVAGQVSKFPD